MVNDSMAPKQATVVRRVVDWSYLIGILRTVRVSGERYDLGMV